jgi:hypothetical protein
MKKHGFLLIVVLISSFWIMGCSTTPKPTPVRYSFAEEWSETASIKFFHDAGWISDEIVDFVDFEGAGLPEPESGTYWENTILFPAGIPFTLNVYVERDRNMLLAGLGNVSTSGDAGVGMLLLLPLFIVILPIDAVTAVFGDRNEYVAFQCPPLESGGEYQLRFNYRTMIKDQLILTNVQTKKRVYVQKVNATFGKKKRQ